MTGSRRALARALVALWICLAALAWTPSIALGAPPGIGDAQNRAVAVNTEDGASVFRLAFSVQWVSDGVVDQTNEAYALASCLDCRTVALAFQVVLVSGDASTVVPENRAVAYNEQCVACLTYASAFQLVLSVDGPSRLTGEGMSRLVRLWVRLRTLERRIDDIPPADLLAEVAAAKAELLTIFTEELVPIGPPRVDDRQERPTAPPTVPTSAPTVPSTVPVSTTTTSPSTTVTSAPATSAPDGTTAPTTTTVAP
jgi:putative peptide zinc metalloprotease protein